MFLAKVFDLYVMIYCKTKYYRYIYSYSSIFGHRPTSKSLRTSNPVYYKKPKLFNQTKNDDAQVISTVEINV